MKAARPLVLTAVAAILGTATAWHSAPEPQPRNVAEPEAATPPQPQVIAPIAAESAMSASVGPPPVPTTSPGASVAKSETPRLPQSDLSSPSSGLIVEDKLVPGRAMQLLDTGFDDLLAELREQAGTDAGALELRRLYIDQINELLLGTEVSLRRLECGARVCAAEVYEPDGTDPADPDRFHDRLPRQARVELALLDDDHNALRRFVFSIDPDVTSLHAAGRNR